MGNVQSAPEISVVVPCRNVAAWLPRCLESVFAALPESGEVVAVDDGSTDGTHAALEAFAVRDPRLRVIAQPHRGVSAARNAALDSCRGELVFFVDPDDAVEPDFFSAMADAMRRDSADYCLAGFSRFGEDGEPLGEWKLRDRYRFSANAEIRESYLPRIFGYSMDDVRAWYAGRPLFAGRELAYAVRAAFRREVIERHGVRFDETLELNEDAIFNAEYLLHAGSMTCVDRPLYKVFTRAGGAEGTIRSDAGRYVRSKLAVHAARRRLDAAEGGALAPLYAGSCVFAALEILSLAASGRVRRRDGFAALRTLLSDGAVRRALPQFPLSWRKPQVAAAVAALRALSLFRWKTTPEFEKIIRRGRARCPQRAAGRCAVDERYAPAAKRSGRVSAKRELRSSRKAPRESEGSRADREAGERTSETKCPQGAARVAPNAPQWKRNERKTKR